MLALVSWFIRVVVTRREPLPKPGAVAFFFLLMQTGRLGSLVNSPKPALALYDGIHAAKFALIGFWIAHHIRREQLAVLFTCLLFGIVVEGPIALYERATGNVGIGRLKFNASAADFGRQYSVLGLDQVRAEGTTFDSHSLGLYLAMLLPLALLLMMQRSLPSRHRLMLLALFVLGSAALVVTFSRSSWVACAIALFLTTLVLIFLWGEAKALPLVLVLLLALTLLYPRGYSYVHDRLMNSPPEIMQERADMNRTGREIMLRYPLFGYGWLNGLDLLEDPAITVHGNGEQPVHNLLWIIGSDMGLFGAVGFFGMIGVGMLSCLSPLVRGDFQVRSLALGILAGLFAFLLHGWTTGTVYLDPVPYYLFWVELALAQSLHRLMTESQRRTPG